LPKHPRSKDEVDDGSGGVWLGPTLFSAPRYPASCGFIPRPLAGDGDPLDVLVLMDEAVYPGVHVWARPVAVLEMLDEAGPDAKVLAVPFGDHRWAKLQDIEDIPSHLREEIDHSLDAYKAP